MPSGQKIKYMRIASTNLTNYPHLLLDSPSLDPICSRNHTIVEGSNLTLQCTVAAANPEPNITWYSVTANSIALAQGVNLTFINISRTDAGKYYCVARNRVGKPATSGVSEVNVLCKYLHSSFKSKSRIRVE